MKRNIYLKLLEWKQSKSRKPLLLEGARQVGKTWLIREFATHEYKEFYYFNFEDDPELNNIFSGNKDPAQLIEKLSLKLNKKIVSEDTLICFDEIQLCTEALTSLKYFQEKAPEYHIISAGSLLGVSIGKQSSFPVGKVNLLTLYPLSFSEFLEAIGEKMALDFVIKNTSLEAIPDFLHEKLLELLKRYMFLGGMPEVIQDYITNKDIRQVRQIQMEILKSYQRDFSKYADKSQSLKISEIWNSIPYQLAKENKKFKYKDVNSNARASTYEMSFEWLRSAGLIYKVYQIRASKLPLAGYADHSIFKLYSLDTGLLAAMLNLTPEIILKPSDIFTEYNGAFVENLVCGELIKSIAEETSSSLFYWSSDRIVEVDFIFQFENEIIPLEVKSGLNKNTKNLRSYEVKFKPKTIIRASPRNFDKQGNFINIPLYALMGLNDILHVYLNQQS
ncbi:MAG: ATP-binding protein [Saprospiraceae bacterium]|nr:ATP-binding protein [Saprospiraceae bacterium]